MNITQEELEGYTVKQFLNYQMTLGKITFHELVHIEREIGNSDKSVSELTKQEADLIKLYIKK